MAALEAPVSVRDLEKIKDVLTSAYYQNIALDMVDAYSKLDYSGRQSPLTKTLEREISTVENYITIAEDDEEPTDE